jgi:FKBP-type peptidyl-prolyl cis-trans isomerase 2
MSEAKKGDKVKIHYKGTLEDGSVFDSSEGRDPLEFTLGEGMVIPGFDLAVTGMKVDDEKKETITPEDGYGVRMDELVMEVDRSQMPEGMPVEIGQSLEMRDKDGNAVPIEVIAYTDDKVTLDANHPLSGKALTFEIKLVEIN